MTWLGASFALMRAMTPVGHGLAARPAHEGDHSVHAGLTFTSLRTLAWLPESSAAAVVLSRMGELRERAMALPVVPVAGESASTWEGVITALRAQEAKLAALAGPHSARPEVSKGLEAPSDPPTPVPVRAPIAAAAPATTASPQVASPPAPEVAHGKALTIIFDGVRCIHARHCVLEAPMVFLANTPGEWIHPDRLKPARLIEVAHKCPSGAIRYERHDGGAPETAPPVNLLRVRENGPYALHADHEIVAYDTALRATLCRCGASQRKPWCDGSHAAADFAATGEPGSSSFEAAAQRDGRITVTPQRAAADRGSLELCTGTGKTFAKLGAPNAGEARLCRCGQSRGKPFCDGSHVGAGFVADGR